jgi:glc operon protein GlcG
MKIRIALTAAIAAIALSGTAMAAATLNDVVQKGEWADRIKEKNQLNIATAERIAKHCVDAARARNLGVSVAIVDQFGVIIYYYRADGQGKANTETALMKAKTVLNTRQPSKAQMNAVRSGANSEARVISFGNFANAGALPIVVEGQFLGAIGVGGMAADVPRWSDEICAHNALTAVLGPQPPLLPDLPNPFLVNNPGQRADAK